MKKTSLLITTLFMAVAFSFASVGCSADSAKSSAKSLASITYTVTSLQDSVDVVRTRLKENPQYDEATTLKILNALTEADSFYENSMKTIKAGKVLDYTKALNSAKAAGYTAVSALLSDDKASDADRKTARRVLVKLEDLDSSVNSLTSSAFKTDNEKYQEIASVLKTIVLTLINK